MNKIVLVLMLSLVCFAFPVAAQDIVNVEVISSQVALADSYLEQTLPSDLGGLISSFQDHYIYKVLEFAGIILHQEDSIVNIESFELFAFPSSSTPNMNTLSVIDVFVESEPVILEGRTTTEHIWITNSVDASYGEGVDFQTIAGIMEWIPNSLGQFRVVSINETDVLHEHASLGEYSEPIQECDSTCPANSDLAILGLIYGEDFNVIKYTHHEYLIGDQDVLILYFDTELIGFLADLDNDGLWNFAENIVPGFSVNSFEQNVLLLSPPGIYDIYVVV